MFALLMNYPFWPGQSPPQRIRMKNEWDVESAIATYNVEGWGNGYFTVNSSGNVEVKPLLENGGSIDLLEVVQEARARNLSFPLLIRFQDLCGIAWNRSTAPFRTRWANLVTKTSIAASSRSRSTNCAKSLRRSWMRGSNFTLVSKPEANPSWSRP